MGSRPSAGSPGDDAPSGLGLLLLAPRLLLDLFLLFQHRPLLRDLDVVDRYVDLRDPQPGQALHPVNDVAAHGLPSLRDGLAVLDGHRQVDGRLLLADLDADAAGVARARAAGHALQEAPDGRAGAAAHLYLLHLLGRDAGDLLDHRGRYRGAAAVAVQRALPLPVITPFGHASPSFPPEAFITPERRTGPVVRRHRPKLVRLSRISPYPQGASPRAPRASSGAHPAGPGDRPACR